MDATAIRQMQNDDHGALWAPPTHYTGAWDIHAGPVPGGINEATS